MKKTRLVLYLLLGVLCLLSFLCNRSIILKYYKNAIENCKDEKNEMIPSARRPQKTDLQKKVDAIFKKIDELMPNVPFTHFDKTTSGKHSIAFLVNPKAQYCVGEDLVVQIDTFDHTGVRKKHGGDHIRARLFSPELGASVTGQVEDLNNGSYHVHFHLFWEGKAKVSLWLYHPSEGVAALWRARNTGQGVLAFEGKFKKLGKEAVTKCDLQLHEEEGKEICEYLDPPDEEAYYCYKAPNFPCESLTEMKGYKSKIQRITPDESKVVESSNIGVDIPQKFDSISIKTCGVLKETQKPKCRTGMGSPQPSGYFYNNIWHPVYCNMTVYKSAGDFLKCLEKKKVFLIGDSTIRQYIMHLSEDIKIVNYLRLHQAGWGSWNVAVEAMNREKDIYVSYKRHGFPLEHHIFYYSKEDMYTSRQIDQRGGGKDTIFIITLGHHFRHCSLKVFIKRALNIRRAVERLFLRSPETKVIIKSENTRELNCAVELHGDFHGYTQYLVLREVFQGVNVGFVDAWDMTVADGSTELHPIGYLFANIMSLTLSFAC